MLSPQWIPCALTADCCFKCGRVLLRVSILCAVAMLAACQSAPSGQASFRRVELADRVPANGQLLLADVGGDAAIDIVVMNRQPGRLVWFENPGWQLKQIALVADSLHGMAAYNPPDSGGPASLTLNGRFSQPGAGTRQQLVWLQNPGREAAHQPWPVSLIRDDVQQGMVLWADMTGTGRQILVTLPALDAYTLPRNPARMWWAVPLTQDPLLFRRVRVFDWDLDGREDLLVAGDTGLDIMALASRGLFVDEFNLISVAPAGNRDEQSSELSGNLPTSGFMDVGVGQSGRTAGRFIATLSTDARELMVFRPDGDENLSWVGESITNSLLSAAAIRVADLNRDSIDEIIVGHAHGLSVFYFVTDQQRWRQYSVESSVAIADVQVQDLTGNGFPDIVVAPAETGPVLLFQNQLQN